MAIKDTLLPEFDQEIALTRKMLERVPEDALDWQPHAKSMTLGRLATHLAETVAWGERALTSDSFDVLPPGSPPPVRKALPSRAAMLELLDRNAARSRAAIASTDDAAFGRPWSLLRGGATVFTLPRIGIVRTMLLSHLIHHRGQFSVYLRMRDVPVPGMYGPSADER
ncbi:MAG TPA: DinB family protein [Gemmatimonadales bacterium]|nr:DinB family protein [Gemmatimonadales bacterium]